MKLGDLRGLGPKRLAALNENGMHTPADLLQLLPRSYLDTRVLDRVSDLRPGRQACVEVSIVKPPTIRYAGGLSIVHALAEDVSGQVMLTWFNQPWNKAHSVGDRLLLAGIPEKYKGQLSLQNPRKAEGRGLYPRYAPVGAIPGKVIASYIEQVLPLAHSLVPETLPATLRERWHLMDGPDALRQAHKPTSGEALMLAQRRVAFEQLLLYQVALQSLHQRNAEGPVIDMAEQRQEAFWRQTGFTPTRAQRTALDTILSDMRSARAMRRLVQGDVGSGKTAVAFGAVLAAADAGYQSAFMVPTEILARQHLESARRLLEPLGVRCGLLLGGMKAAERWECLKRIADGSWDLVIGTQALFSEGVTYGNLGLVITDEQHRFGVRQRQRLSSKATALEAHVLVMSATPIPRTLALILYGDLEVSLIDEMPPGREPVKTRIVPEEKRAEMYAFIREKAAKGEQAYLVCPLVEESEQVEAKDARQMFETLRKGPLKSLRLGLTWGTQPSEEKEATIAAFSRGDLDVLVATTVIEVGVNVPKATVMVVENAERFGLGQLHQLRGRVGRGGGESWCFLMGESTERLQTLRQSNDGFFIAQKDLELRGPGDFLGTRQSGRLLPDAPGASDMRLVEEAGAAARALIQERGLFEEAQAVRALALKKYRRVLEEIALH